MVMPRIHASTDMTEPIDFGDLYRRIRVTPGCSLQEFQLAYRRRVAALHPDRGEHADAAQLQQLNALYTAAMEFHKQSGRLPGARSRRAARTDIPARRAQPAHPETRRTRGHHRWLLAGLLITLLVLALIGRDSVPPPLPSNLSTVSDTSRGASSPAAIPRYVDLGMEPDMVRAVEGEPVLNADTQWHYGPSWIEFRCGMVDDWYSSPLRPLHVRSTRPVTHAGRAAYECEDYPGQELRL